MPRNIVELAFGIMYGWYVAVAYTKRYFPHILGIGAFVGLGYLLGSM